MKFLFVFSKSYLQGLNTSHLNTWIMIQSKGKGGRGGGSGKAGGASKSGNKSGRNPHK